MLSPICYPSAYIDAMNRRDFARVSALALAATRLPAQASAPEPKPIGFAAVGLGQISEIFCRGLVTARDAKLTAVVTGHPADKGKHYTELYDLAPHSIYTYDTYAKLRDNHAVDAVYIGLPNSMHCDYTVRAAEAGKHVLCEKPMAISSAECRRMIDACRAANVRLMIAYRLWYDPTVAQAAAFIKSGALGEIQSFQGAFIGNMRPNQWRLDKAFAGGGSIFDLGIYPLNAIRLLSGENPSAYTAVVSTRDKTSGKFATMEQSIEWTMKFPSGIIASCRSSYGANAQDRLEINGDKGYLVLSPAYGYDGMKLTGRTADDTIDVVATGKMPFQFTLEADHMADCIRTNKTPKTSGELGLADLESIEAIYKAAGAPLA
jgi:predicted dehydrogenase